MANRLLRDGEVVGIFPEGGITRTGQLQAFKPGMLRIIAGTDAVVVPVYLDGLWGSIFSYSGGRFIWKIPRRWRYPISVYFGKPLHNVVDVHEVRQAVQALGAAAMQQRKQKLTSVPVAHGARLQEAQIPFQIGRLDGHGCNRWRNAHADAHRAPAVTQTRAPRG